MGESGRGELVMGGVQGEQGSEKGAVGGGGGVKKMLVGGRGEGGKGGNGVKCVDGEIRRGGKKGEEE